MVDPRRLMFLVIVALHMFVSPAVADDDTAPAMDTWRVFISAATEQHGEVGQRAAMFLHEHHPPRDADIDLDILMSNLEYALKARAAFPWAKELTEDQFFNDFLPYACLDETRESWRPAMYERCRPIVKDCTTAAEAAQALNRDLFNLINVHYNIKREKNNQSPAESMRQSMATCTGLSILLVDACRSVGVAARIAGVADWHDNRGNHTWVEIWDGQQWRFTGADEYDAAGLDRAWFIGSAAKATAGSVRHGVWATSWRDTGAHFPLSWNMTDTTVPGVDVTSRYTGEVVEPGGQYVRLWATKGGERLVATIEALDAAGTVIGRGETRAGTADMNDMLQLPVNDAELLRVHNGGCMRLALPSDASIVELYWDELGLTRDEAAAMIETEFRKRAAAIAEERDLELQNKAFAAGKYGLFYLEKVFGEAPPPPPPPNDGHALYISLHGGGGAPKEVNDQQWRNQAKLYEPEAGIYIAPRAPHNTWDLWHRHPVDVLLDRLIETYIATRNVDPNRVYLMGYSAGGDGVFQLAPRMADRFAAASMMAGHPNETQPDGLRNLPFAIFMGGEDSAYDRNKVAHQWKVKLAALHEEDPEGYKHRVDIYDGLGHWMEKRDAVALEWMEQFERNPWPKKIIWRQDDVTHRRFYWLSVDRDHERPGSTIRASVDGQTISISSGHVSWMTLRLHDDLIDLDQPIRVLLNGRAPLFEGRVLRSPATIRQSLRERNDPAAAAMATITVGWKL